MKNRPHAAAIIEIKEPPPATVPPPKTVGDGGKEIRELKAAPLVAVNIGFK